MKRLIAVLCAADLVACGTTKQTHRYPKHREPAESYTQQRPLQPALRSVAPLLRQESPDNPGGVPVPTP